MKGFQSIEVKCALVLRFWADYNEIDGESVEVPGSREYDFAHGELTMQVITSMNGLLAFTQESRMNLDSIEQVKEWYDMALANETNRFDNTSDEEVIEFTLAVARRLNV